MKILYAAIHETSARTIAAMLPRKVIYWAVIRAGAHATRGKWKHREVPATTIMEILERWDEPNADEVPR